MEYLIMNKRIVITGLGTVNPIGNNVDDTWSSIQAGKCGIGPITQFDTTDFDVKIAAEVKDFDPSLWMDPKNARKMARFAQFAVAASKQAYDDANLASAGYDPTRIGICIGNGIGGFEVLETSMKRYYEGGPRKILPLTIPEIISNEGPANVAKELGIKGFALSVMTACTSGADAIGHALDMLRCGRCDVCLAGGTESCLVGIPVAGFSILHALSTRNDAPEKACRPFDKDRDGFIMGEGAAVLILEEYEHAKARGAKIYAELAGYGLTCDAYHLTAPDPSGEQGVRAIRLALEDANVKPEEVQYYNAHGTSTPINDPLETKMVKEAFGEHAYKMKVSSTKSMTGHLIAASGSLEALICALAIKNSFYPPTINLDEPDVEAGCDLDYVANKGVEGEIDVAVSGSLGFGGHNGVLVLRKVRD